MTSRSWEDSVERTWLGKPKLRAQLDQKIRGWLGSHRNLRGKVLDSVSPFTMINIEALRLIRNATCHPAHHSARESGAPAVQQLVEHIRNFDQEAALVSAIEKEWSTLRRRDLRSFPFASSMLRGFISELDTRSR